MVQLLEGARSLMDTSGQPGSGNSAFQFGLPPLSQGARGTASFGLTVGQRQPEQNSGAGFREDARESERAVVTGGGASGELGSLQLPNSSLRINPAVFGDLLSQISEYPASGSRHRRVMSDTPVPASDNAVMDDVDMGGDISEAAGDGLLSDMVDGARGSVPANNSLSAAALFSGAGQGLQEDKLGSRGGTLALASAAAAAAVAAAGAGPNLGLGGGAGASPGSGGGGAGGASSGYHSRSFSVDDAFLFKAGPLKEALSPIMSPIAPTSRSRRGSEGGLSIKDEVDELEDSEAIQRVMATKKPAVDEHIDAKKAKR